MIGSVPYAPATAAKQLLSADWRSTVRRRPGAGPSRPPARRIQKPAPRHLQSGGGRIERPVSSPSADCHQCLYARAFPPTNELRLGPAKDRSESATASADMLLD